MRLILTSEQTKKLSSVTGKVEVIDAVGRTIGQFTLVEPTVTETQELSSEDYAELRRHIGESSAEKGSVFTAQQIRDRA